MPIETVLETERLRLTNWSPEQIDDLALLHSDPEVTRHFSVGGAPETRQMVEDRLMLWSGQFATNRLGKLRAALKADGSFVGRAGFGIYARTGEPEIGFAFLRHHWGQGFATEAASGLRDWLFVETDFDHFIGFADINNHASLRVLRKIGMIPTHIGVEPDGLECAFHVFHRKDWND